VSAAGFAEPVLLMKHGFSESTAFGMSRAVRLAALIVIGQSEGGVWDYSEMKWQEKK
jgi:hypothetical protein